MGWRRSRGGPNDWGASETHDWGLRSSPGSVTEVTEEGSTQKPQGTQVPTGWVELFDSVAPSQATLFSQILSDQGITVVRRDNPSGSLFGLGNIPQQLLIKAEDQDKALEVMKEWNEAPPDFPDDLADE
jgi:hypothetical protein